MRLSKKQRDEVVDLLRCAADFQFVGATTFPMMMAVEYTGIDHPAFLIAIDALKAATPDDTPPGRLYGERMLEAAMRVELEEWP